MTNEIQTKDDNAVDPETEAFLRADAIVAAINANLPDGVNGLPPIPKDYVFKKLDRKAVGLSFHTTFHLIGGVPGMAQWAMANPSAFYALYQKFGFQDIDSPTGNTFVFNSSLPASPLDLVNVRDGVVFQEPDAELPE